MKFSLYTKLTEDECRDILLKTFSVSTKGYGTQYAGKVTGNEFTIAATQWYIYTGISLWFYAYYYRKWRYLNDVNFIGKLSVKEGGTQITLSADPAVERRKKISLYLYDILVISAGVMLAYKFICLGKDVVLQDPMGLLLWFFLLTLGGMFLVNHICNTGVGAAKRRVVRFFKKQMNADPVA